MKKSLRKTIAFICALTLTAGPLTLSARSLPAFAEETVTVQSESGEVTQEQIEKNIVGTWVLAEVDGQPALTNDKSVFTIVSPTEAYSSVSRVNAQGSPWHSHTECDITIDGNVVTITNHTESGTTIEHQFAITEISSDSFTANRVFMRSSKNAEPRVTEDIVTFVKTDDNAEVVFGTWQGVCTSGDYEFDDGNEHRWEYKPDGTYVYYSKKGDSWVPIDSANCEYFVAGNLMFTRWFDPDGNEFREQWEFTVENGKMSWTALRANEDGSTFTATFEMNKIEENTAVKHKISDEEIVQWTSKDYKDKTGTNANAAITKRSDDKYEITLTDDEGNVLDTYTVNPDTGIGTNEVGEEVDLPQTGINTMGAASAISGAVLMAAAGAWMIFKSSKKKEEEE